MFKKIITCIACIIPITACSVNFFRGEFGYIDHHIAIDDLIRAEWHFKKTGIDPYKKTSSEYIPDYIIGLSPENKHRKERKKEDYVFMINDKELMKNEDFLIRLLNAPCESNIMNNDDRSFYQPDGLSFPFGRMKSIIRCKNGYYKLEKISENIFVIKY
ncbi:TPA: hypothetical protein ACK3JW_000236 [Mannheimia haemolytica]